MTTPIGTADFVPATASTPQDTLIVNGGSTSVGPGATVDLGQSVITAPGYTQYIDVLYPSGALGPFVGLLVSWIDPTTSLIIAQEQYVATGTQNSPASGSMRHYGRGPTKTALVDVQLTNYDMSTTATVNYYLWQSDRIITRDDFRATLWAGTTPNWNLIAANPAYLLLARTIAATVGVGNSITRLIPPYAGQVNLMLSGSIAGWGWTLQAVQPQLGLTAASWPLLFPPQTNLAEDAQFETGFIFPRTPTLLTVSNTGASSLTVAIGCQALEFAS